MFGNTTVKAWQNVVWKSDIPPVMASISSEVQSNHDHLFNKCGIGKLTRVNL